ncbi:MAG: hypothetical protein OEM62_06065 [Acidobacteriota bacterium]|nr:hypothetical protein [Acidobacteriota bacterium]
MRRITSGILQVETEVGRPVALPNNVPRVYLRNPGSDVLARNAGGKKTARSVADPEVIWLARPAGKEKGAVAWRLASVSHVVSG